MAQSNLVIEQMDNLLASWEAGDDRRRIFLGCYKMMTQNMLDALLVEDFEDVVWVTGLLEHFAAYYFKALETYEQGQNSAPKVWQYAFEASRRPQTNVLQNLVLGVNAHINYDLVFAISDLLLPEWDQLSEEQLQVRYRDHCHVNDIIYKTIDRVQDQIIERFDPGFGLIDKLLGPLDEWMTRLMISDWREEVWKHAVHLIETRDEQDRLAYTREVEEFSIKRAQSILGEDGLIGLVDLV